MSQNHFGVLLHWWNALGPISTVIKMACTLNFLHCARSLSLSLSPDLNTSFFNFYIYIFSGWGGCWLYLFNSLELDVSTFRVEQMILALNLIAWNFAWVVLGFFLMHHAKRLRIFTQWYCFMSNYFSHFIYKNWFWKKLKKKNEERNPLHVAVLLFLRIKDCGTASADSIRLSYLASFTKYNW